MYGILKKSLFISMAGTLLAATSCQMTPKMSEKECVTKNVYENVPFEMPEVLKPVFPDYQVNIRDFGAKSGGKELCTEAIKLSVRYIKEVAEPSLFLPDCG